MKPLSNFLRRSSAADPVHCRRAHREELHGALRVVLGSLRYPADESHVAEFIGFTTQRGIPVTEVFVAVRRGRLLWAMLPVSSPGRTALLLSPADVPGGGDADAAASLIDVVCADCAAHGLQLAQVLLDPSDEAVRRLYLGREFRLMAELLYLQTNIRRGIAAAPALPVGFSWLPYSPGTHDLFAETIAQTYEQSLDCPGLNGLRDIEDIIAGHKSSGEHDPAMWLLLCRSTDGKSPRPLGALLLSRLPRNHAMELVYLGLAPSARGGGIGDLMLRQALYLAASEDVSTLTLAVDARNTPALKLYYRHGFQRGGIKLALIREVGLKR